MNKMILIDKGCKYGTIIIMVIGTVILYVNEQGEAAAGLTALLGVIVRTVFSSGEKALTEQGGGINNAKESTQSA